MSIGLKYRNVSILQKLKPGRNEVVKPGDSLK